MARSVTVYTTQYCPHCVKVKTLLERKRIPFEEIDLTQDAAKREDVSRKTGWTTVPMIFIGDEFVGGADELYSLEEQGELDAKVRT